MELKKNIISIIIAVIVIPFVAGIWNNTRYMDKVKEKQDEQEKINVDMNTRIYNIEKWRMSDSIEKQIRKELGK